MLNKILFILLLFSLSHADTLFVMNAVSVKYETLLSKIRMNGNAILGGDYLSMLDNGDSVWNDSGNFTVTRMQGDPSEFIRVRFETSRILLYVRNAGNLIVTTDTTFTRQVDVGRMYLVCGDDLAIPWPGLTVNTSKLECGSAWKFTIVWPAKPVSVTRRLPALFLNPALKGWKVNGRKRLP